MLVTDGSQTALVPVAVNGMVSGPGIGLEKKSFLNETGAPPTKRARLGLPYSYSYGRLQIILLATESAENVPPFLCFTRRASFLSI